MSSQRQIPPEAMEALRAGNHRKAVEILVQQTGGDLKSAIELAKRVGAVLNANSAPGAGVTARNAEETRGQRENRERTEELMRADTHTPTVMPGDSTSRLVPWMVVLILVAVLYWMFGG